MRRLVAVGRKSSERATQTWSYSVHDQEWHPSLPPEGADIIDHDLFRKLLLESREDDI